MKNTLAKISNVIKTIFGYGIMITLFAGGFTFFGYVAALIIGGDIAAKICEIIYKNILPIIIYTSTVFAFLGLVSMYLVGESSLTTAKKKTQQSKNQALSEEGER